MFAIDEEKLPPPKPAVAAQANRTQNWAPWLSPATQPLGTTIARSRAGISSSEALIVVLAGQDHAGEPGGAVGAAVAAQVRAEQLGQLQGATVLVGCGAARAHHIGPLDAPDRYRALGPKVPER